MALESANDTIAFHLVRRPLRIRQAGAGTLLDSSRGLGKCLHKEIVFGVSHH